MAKAPPVPAAIMQTTTNLRTREAMMVGSHLEGGWYPPFPVGDQGTSFGPYQMHIGGKLTSLGFTPAQAEDPVKATKGMLSSYVDAVNQISEQLWTSNPEKAAEESAFIAEGPAQDYYSGQGPQAVDNAWINTQDVLAGKKSKDGMPQGGSNQPPSGPPFWQAVIQAVSGDPTGIEQYTAAKVASGQVGGFANIWSFFSNPTDALERLGLIVFGAIIIIVGLVILATGTRAGKALEAGATRGVSSRVASTISGSAEERENRRADQQRRLGIAEKANQLGERKLALKESRENRLTARANVQRPATGRHRRTEQTA